MKAGAASVLVASGVRPAFAAWPDPSRPIRLVITQATGSGVDATARALADHWSEKLGTQVIVDSKPGGNGTIAMDTVARAVPDGNTLVFAVYSQFAQATVLMKKPPLDPLKALTPVALMGTGVGPLLVRKDLPARTFKEFIAYAKEHPVTYGAFGIGSNAHLMMMQLAKDTNAKISTAQYKGSGLMLTDLAGGHVDCGIASLHSATPHMQSGRVRPILTVTNKRSSALPGIPTWTEEGLTAPVYDLAEYFFIGGPAGLPREISARLGSLTSEAVQVSDKVKSIRKSMFEEEAPILGDALTRYIERNVPVWQATTRSLGISLE